MEINEILKLVHRVEKLETLFEVLDEMILAKEKADNKYISVEEIRYILNVCYGEF